MLSGSEPRRNRGGKRSALTRALIYENDLPSRASPSNQCGTLEWVNPFESFLCQETKSCLLHFSPKTRLGRRIFLGWLLVCLECTSLVSAFIRIKIDGIRCEGSMGENIFYRLATFFPSSHCNIIQGLEAFTLMEAKGNSWNFIRSEKNFSSWWIVGDSSSCSLRRATGREKNLLENSNWIFQWARVRLGDERWMKLCHELAAAEYRQL